MIVAEHDAAHLLAQYRVVLLLGRVLVQQHSVLALGLHLLGVLGPFIVDEGLRVDD